KIVVKSGGKTESRCDVPIRRRNHRCIAGLLITWKRWTDEQTVVRIIVRNTTMNLSEGREHVVAKTKVQSEPRARTPVILNIDTRLPRAETVLHERVIALRCGGKALQKVSQRFAGVRAVEGIAALRRVALSDASATAD